MTTKRTTIYLTFEVYDWLAEMAKRERRSLSSMTESILDAYRLNMAAPFVDTDPQITEPSS